MVVFTLAGKRLQRLESADEKLCLAFETASGVLHLVEIQTVVVVHDTM